MRGWASIIYCAKTVKVFSACKEHKEERTRHITMMHLPLAIVSAARSLTCRDDLDSKWRLLLAENELSCVSLLSSISIGN